MEDEKLAAFEKGYQAGWDDAVKAQADTTAKISADLGQNLQDMAFTYHEALSKLTVSIEPIMAEIVEKLLPEFVKKALGAHIVEQICQMIKDNAEQPVEIVVAPANVETVQELAQGKISSPFEIVAEASLGDGQAFVRIGSAERSVDIDTVIAGISEAMTAFFHEADQENENG
ncbi:ABC transporter ATP-binding protein [Roseobacter insulae]|uniref:ABC transporter ATP-binding protein n=1 Tax=Roseobacter insulae TaxID=2859783 RepID=UPI002151681C|nr:ABC transporter ATP-binding protein [Roseobacter insulae]